jgi:hypothetical protein
LNSKAVSGAVAALIALLVYLEMIEWVDLFPWNDIRGGNGQAALDIALGVVLSLLIVGVWWRKIFAAVAAALFCAIWLWLQIETWWVAYLLGASPGWKHVYARVFSSTVKILPADADHPAPDAAHLILHMLIVLALFASLFAAIALYRARIAIKSAPAK